VPGEFVNLRMVLLMRRDVATVPSQTVQDGPQGHYAYVIAANDTVERRQWKSPRCRTVSPWSARASRRVSVSSSKANTG